MNKKLLTILFLSILITPSYLSSDVLAVKIPPTPAFSKIYTDNEEVHALNYSMPLILQGGGGITVNGINGTHTIIINGTGSGGGSTNCTALTVSDETNNRNFTQVFHNTSGKTIMVVVSSITTASDGQFLNTDLYAFISPTNDPIGNGTLVDRNSLQIHITTGVGVVTYENAVVMLVPNGYYYAVNSINGGDTTAVLDIWIEYQNPNCGNTFVTNNNITNLGKQGSYNETLANNILKNKNGFKLNFINGTGNPINIKNSSSGQQVNITISSGSSGQNNTGANLGTSGTGVFASMSGSILQFLKLISTNSFLGITSNGTNVIFTISSLVSHVIAGTGISVNQTNGNVLVSNTGVTGIAVTSPLAKNATTGGVSLSCPTCGDGTVKTSANIGKATGSVGVLAQPTSTSVNGRNLTGTSPIVVTKTNDTDIALSCPTCRNGLTSIGIVINGLNRTSFATLANLTTTNNQTFSGKINFTGSASLAPVNFGSLGANPTNPKPGDFLLNTVCQCFSYYDSTGSNRNIVDLRAFQNLQNKMLFTNSFFEDPTDTTKQLKLLLSGSTTGKVLTIRSNQTTSQGINIPNIRETEFFAIRPQTTSTTNSTTQTTTSTTLLMGGNTASITPQVTGNIRISLSGTVSSSALSDGCKIQIQYGTGTAPHTGQSITGTTAGLVQTLDSGVANANLGNSMTTTATGLTVGTAYWVQAAYAADVAGTCSVKNQVYVLQEY